MFQPFALFLGLRYSRTRRSSRFVSFISASSIIGIALGVMALILGLSAMNGFERELRQRVLAVIPHAEVEMVSGGFSDWQSASALLKKQPGITAVAPLISLNGMLEAGGKMKAAQLRAVLPAEEKQISQAAEYMTGSGLDALLPGENGVILGQQIADKLGVKIGDSVTMQVPDKQAQSAFSAPMQRQFTVVGLLKLGGQLDGFLGYIHLQDAQAMLGWQDEVQGLSIEVNDVLSAHTIAYQAANQLPYRMYLRSWMTSQGYLYQDIQMVRTVMYVVLLMVVAVACFNIVSTLVMAVNEKRGDIAILKTMGASDWQIRLVFMTQGMVNGLVGAGSGALLGCILAQYLSSIIHGVERVTGYQFLNPEIYFIDFLPSELHLLDVAVVTTAAVLMSLLATLYPAWRASQLLPARELGR
ncbi:lipoprotein releasing system, transmembrane protein, LolC/E family [Tolumonas auensis DSM 9187]|uniref:Lipoprotein releasing system, transmembrane protein, LolC/E family n=1 Tax=Tolumonas auensis (strain DSM 9187 / NBRC 110442 / TA 4) TaxID=595494 RepID=C4L8W6_TOLAT|nr:lipoprotein releasing system, transmembrane protein, LolC/E family [Tolumonas auensis DSM 9187]